MKALQLEKKQLFSKNLVLITNGALLGGQIGALVIWILKINSNVNLQQLGFLAGISVLSFLGFSLKNSWGWLLAALPAFCHLLVHYIHGSKAYYFDPFPSILLLIVFNSVFAMINTKEYQQYFNLRGRQLLLMNFLALGLSMLLVTGGRYYHVW